VSQLRAEPRPAGRRSGAAAVCAGLLVLALLLSAPGCAQKEIRGGEVTGLDRKLSTFAWIEHGDLVTFIVNTKSSRYRDEAPYVPVEIAVSNNGLKKLFLTRESFTLVDENGDRYPVATPRELIEGYEYLDFDRRLAEIESIVFNRFATYTRYGSNFSPTRASTRIVRDTVSLPRFGYMIDFIYFPRPSSGVLGKKFELFMDSPDLPDPVFVKFQVE
jgi:hypothetical protein